MGAASAPDRHGLRRVAVGCRRQQRRDLRVMALLVDTSILIRLANRADAAYPVADRAIMELHRRGELLHLTPQNLVEFRNVATRPVVVNGLGLAVAVAEAKAADFESVFPLLPETPDIFPAW